MVLQLREANFKYFKPISLAIANGQRWAVTGPSRSRLLEIFAGEHTPDPPTSRTYTWGNEYWPSQVISRVEFGQGAQSNAPYLGARFESYVDEFDYSLRDTLLQNAPQERVDEILKSLKLDDIADRWIVGLSNGQSRRAQIAQALLKDPKLLIVNDPFLGVDPDNRKLLNDLLYSLPIAVILGLCTSQPLPEWITHVAHATDQVSISPRGEYNHSGSHETRREPREFGETVLEVNDLTATIRSGTIFKDLSFSIRRGERLFLKGSNGSGKSTLMAILTADHPQGWSADIRTFGTRREVGKDSYFSINKEIGLTSPELHAIFPKYLKAWDAISTGYRGDFMKRTDLKYSESEKIDKFMNMIRVNNVHFGELNKQDQKLVLFARALIKDPALVLLDEAFSTFDEQALDLAFKILDEYNGAVVVTGHHAREIPPFDVLVDLTTFKGEE